MKWNFIVEIATNAGSGITFISYCPQSAAQPEAKQDFEKEYEPNSRIWTYSTMEEHKVQL